MCMFNGFKGTSPYNYLHTVDLFKFSIFISEKINTNRFQIFNTFTISSVWMLASNLGGILIYWILLQFEYIYVSIAYLWIPANVDMHTAFATEVCYKCLVSI